MDRRARAGAGQGVGATVGRSGALGFSIILLALGPPTSAATELKRSGGPALAPVAQDEDQVPGSPPIPPGEPTESEETVPLRDLADPLRQLDEDRLDRWPDTEGRGITLDFGYAADFYYNLRGGLNTSDAEQFRGLFNVDLTLETGELGLWEDGLFFFQVINNHGTDISERHVGDLQALNNNDAPNDTRFYEYWYEHAFLDGALRLKLGKIDSNADFAAPLYGGEFVHSSAGFSPTIPIPTWPDPALGVVLFADPAEWLSFRIGLFDALGVGTRSGFETAFQAPDESFTIAELGISLRLPLFQEVELPGLYRIGGFYHDGQWEEFPAGRRDEPGLHRGNSGVYVIIDQALYKENPEDEEDEQGLGMFLQFSWVPQAYNEITEHYGFGLQYVGLIPGRDLDIAGFGVQHVNLSDRIQALERRFSETAIEAFYRYQLNENISFKPDLHYIVNPGGDGRDAIVAGMRVEIALGTG